MSKVIALDIGNVCFNINIQQCLQKLEIIDFELASKLYLMHETGKIDSKTFLEEIKKIVKDNQFEDKKIISIFLSIIGEEISGMKEIVKSLVDKNYRICFLSDTSRLHLNEIVSRLSFAHLVTGGVYSFEVGALKPDIKMFQTFEKLYGRPTLYIDDKVENCVGAEKLGWNAHQFKNVQSLMAVINSL